ncbi:MAG: WYL domain-containing protein [Sulfurimonas sp.]|jgi:predicted DNA-binding transcriptional regulator YafY|uniref:helix-turn-helix transcriptional regulator n=1 Tax=Sulfurimonas sp. TaxID=2022749 RepID=UPI00356A42D1
MKNHDKIATRLAQILNKLNSGERFSVEELVEEFSVTSRTIQRDLNERLSYLPLKKENNLYYLEEYYLGKLNFNDIKNFAALSGVRDLFPSLKEDFLKNILDATINQAYLIKGHNYEDVSSDTETFLRIEIAIVNHTIVEFVYNDKPRTVKPYKLVNTKGIWYLAGVEDDKLKTFSFKKISKVVDTDVEFKIENEILESIKNSDNSWFSSEPIEVVIKVDAEVSGYFTRRKILPNQTIVKELAEGGLLVSAKVAFDEEILKLVRYWIPHVKIISPTYLQEKLEESLKKYLNL